MKIGSPEVEWSTRIENSRHVNFNRGWVDVVQHERDRVRLQVGREGGNIIGRSCDEKLEKISTLYDVEPKKMRWKGSPAPWARVHSEKVMQLAGRLRYALCPPFLPSS